MREVGHPWRGDTAQAVVTDFTTAFPKTAVGTVEATWQLTKASTPHCARQLARGVGCGSGTTSGSAPNSATAPPQKSKPATTPTSKHTARTRQP